MEIRELCDIFNRKGRVTAVGKLLDGDGGRAVIDGLAGSSAAMLFAALPRRSAPYLIIVNDLDEAGYMYNDLCQIVGDKHVLIFPSGYKRDIKYGQVDAPNEILRTEVLNRWYDDPEVRWVVTYPEALAERVRRREDVEASTVQLRAGGTADLVEVLQASGLHPASHPIPQPIPQPSGSNPEGCDSSTSHAPATTRVNNSLTLPPHPSIKENLSSITGCQPVKTTPSPSDPSQ